MLVFTPGRSARAVPSAGDKSALVIIAVAVVTAAREKGAMMETVSLFKRLARTARKKTPRRLVPTPCPSTLARLENAPGEPRNHLARPSK